MNLLDKAFKSAIIHMCKKLKETVSEELKESMRVMSHQIESIIKKRIYKKPTRNYGFEKHNN